MSETLVPDFCMWCEKVKVVHDKCPQCHRIYGTKPIKKILTRTTLNFKDEFEIHRLRRLRFSWEI